jgi:phosphoribosyl 1,2-cyclic phosphate phosphodiesterase
MTVEESVETLQRIKATQSYLVHMCHDVDHTSLAATLPTDIDVAYDGMTLDL